MHWKNSTSAHGGEFQSLVYWKGGDKFICAVYCFGAIRVFQSLVYWKGGDKLPC